MATYDPTAHPLLSIAAAALGVEALAAQADVAESLLGRGSTYLKDTAFEDGSAEYDRAVSAVAIQVSWQVEHGVDLGAIKSWSRGDRSVTYHDGSVSGIISSVALAFVATLIDVTVSEGEWPVAGSLR